MKPIHLDRFDLNLLLVLNRVYVEGSVTRAAASLNLTQSAISQHCAVCGSRCVIRCSSGMGRRWCPRR